MPRIAPRHRAFALLLAGCSSAASAQDSSAFGAWEAMMSRSGVLGLQLSARHRFREGKASKPELDCIEAIAPNAFAGDYRAVLERLLTSEEIRFTESFWQSDVGHRLTQLAEWAAYRDLGLDPPSTPRPMTAAEQAAADVNNTSVAARKLFDWAKKLNGGMDPSAEAHARSLLATCKAKAQE